ncbi:MAG: hypothetical protein U0941_21135 [Planctomycetaceae bacterium]
MTLQTILAGLTSLVTFSLIYASPKSCPGAEIDEIRAQALMHAMLIRSIAYSYEIETNTGWEMKGEFFGEGTRYRVNRTDVQGMLVGGKRIAPLNSASAYNDERYQLLTPDQRRLRIQDGNAEANYSVGTLQTYLYLWLQESGKPFRWDTVLSHASWEQKFKEASYGGRVEENGLECEVVEFPQRRQVKTPCIYRILLVPSLGYLPIKYTRRVEKDDAVSSTMIVEKYKTIQIDGKAVAIPTQIQYTESGADGVSLKQSMKLTLDEKSLKVNEPIDASMFTLTVDDKSWIYDVDHENRVLASVEMPGNPLPNNQRALSPLLVVNISVLAIFVVGYLVYRSIPRATR